MSINYPNYNQPKFAGAVHTRQNNAKLNSSRQNNTQRFGSELTKQSFDVIDKGIAMLPVKEQSMAKEKIDKIVKKLKDDGRNMLLNVHYCGFSYKELGRPIYSAQVDIMKLVSGKKLFSREEKLKTKFVDIIGLYSPTLDGAIGSIFEQAGKRVPLETKEELAKVKALQAAENAKAKK